MKRNTLQVAFEWALATSVLLSVWFFVRFYLQTREMRTLQVETQSDAAHFQNNHTAMGVLLAECQEYAKRNPDMTKLLESIKTTPTPAMGTNQAQPKTN